MWIKPTVMRCIEKIHVALGKARQSLLKINQFLTSLIANEDRFGRKSIKPIQDQFKNFLISCLNK